MERDEVAAALNVWREGLVSLSGANRLIQFKQSRTGSVILDAPSPDEILRGLQSGTPWAVRGDDEDQGAVEGSVPRRLPGQRGQALHSPRPDKDLGPVLRGLMRRATAEFLDRGLSVLYVAFGMLHWKDVDDTTMVSPLLLVPVSLIPEGPKGTPRLGDGDDDTVLNPALALRLRDFNVTLPSMEELDELSVSEVLSRVEDAVADQDGWEVKPTAVLSSFSFAKEAMYRDLQDHEEQILAHPIVRALATSDPTKQSPEFIFDPIDPSEIDSVAPPEDTPLVLDADSSQRVAVAAALKGQTFVMDGPPGTGKSQTIANMIGALLHAGKTVLFVSEKAAALEVVRNRLAEAGLENFLLELHSHKASRKEVAAALLRSLDTEAVPPSGMDGLSRATLIDLRNRLNDYALAMNVQREPLSLSLHYVLGLLSTFQDLPSAPIPDAPPMGLTQADYRAIQETARRLERAWRPAAQGSTFLWRDVTDETSLDIRLYQAESALQQLEGTLGLNKDLIDAFQLTKPSDAAQVISLTEHQHTDQRIGALDHWLTTQDWSQFPAARNRLAADIRKAQDAEAAVLAKSGVPWNFLPNPDDLPQSPDPVPVMHAPVDLTTLTSSTMKETAELFAVRSTQLKERFAALANVSASLGLSQPRTFADADAVIRLTGLVYRLPRPHRRWLSQDGIKLAKQAEQCLRNRVAALTQAEQKASALFTSDALKAPLTELQDRFTNLHRGLKKLSGNYRADKKALAGLLTDAATIDQGIRHLSDAIAWGDIAREYDADTALHADILGEYWSGRQTDFDALQEAIKIAEEAVELTGSAGVPAELAMILTSPESPTGYDAIVTGVRDSFGAWTASLAPAPSLQGRPELVLDPIESSIAWLNAHIEPLRKAAARVDAVDEATGRTHNLGDANEVLELRAAAAAAKRELDLQTATYVSAFGDHFQGIDSNLAALDDSLAWAEHLRSLAGGPVTEGQLKALTVCHLVESLPPVFARWNDAQDRIIEAFAASRTQELRRELDDFRNALELINELRNDSVGQQEWFAYVTACAELARHGLDAAIDFCVEQRVSASQVPAVLERALLRAWADGTIQSDERLRPVLASDRETLVDEYRTLDRKLIANATSDIIRAANTRRPQRTNLGEPAILRRQGMMKRKHMPVRDLIAATRTTSLAIKPCFMMSPLAVSQYLPADINFDVVIFDEASQVTPGDAINCIYRGTALILAGDDKQLPPTSFFERVVEEEGNDETDVADFQSVLELAKGCGAFNNLGLKWHYRSRHEALIAFSNYKFYEGKLITYPSSHSDGEDVGVEFFNAHGTYRRGGGADNPAEAAKVAERVIEHFTNRPDLTLGVVTFSVAQADAVFDAIDKARDERRDLDRFFDSTDRLNGFFVRSLESVQGDERDVIIFSVGYGPDEAGKVSTGFGVLNKPKGWRRLNVGITRARQRVEVIASMRAGDIPPSENENVEYLRAYLDYAERGPSALAIDLGHSGLAPESPFEESVISAILGWGYVVEPQVGAAGFRIDIGVRHPAHPGMFAIGVECDGYQYHSAPAARDRDRLRDQILGGLGWSLHRIWGTAWYRHRVQEEVRLRAAIDAAIAAPAMGRIRQSHVIERPVVTTIEAQTDEIPSWTTPYATSSRQSLPYWVNPSEPGNHLHLVEPLTALAQDEGPIHLDLVYERVRGWWDIGRVSYKLRDNIDLAIRHAAVTREGDFIDVPGRPIDRVRTPAAGVDRKVEKVHVGELRLAITHLLRDVGATPSPELVVGVARIFGWNRTGADISRCISAAIDQLLNAGTIVEEGESLRLARS